MQRVLRFDLQEPELAPPSRTREGYARYDGFLTRTGIFEYVGPDGQIQRELRLPEDVFAPAALKSFDGVPLTLDHPGDLLDPTQARYAARGAVTSPAQAEDGEHVRASILVYDAEAIGHIQSTHQQLSCGYWADLEPIEGGVYQGEGAFKGAKADFLQRNIEGNHVAAVRRGRAGPTARVRLDAAGNAVPHKETSMTTRKIKLDGAEYDVPEHVAVSLEKRDADLKTATGERDARAAELEKLRAERDVLKADLDKARADGAPEAITAKAAAVLDVAIKAAGITGESPLELVKLGEAGAKRKALEKRGIKLDGKSDAYVDAAFDLAADAVKSDAGTQILGMVRSDGARVDEHTKATEAYHARLLAGPSKKGAA